MRKSNQQNIGEIIKELIDTYKIGPQINNAKVAVHWEELMGSQIARQTNRLWVRDGILYISLSSPPLKQELFYAREKICAHINRALGETYLKEVVFR